MNEERQSGRQQLSGNYAVALLLRWLTLQITFSAREVDDRQLERVAEVEEKEEDVRRLGDQLAQAVVDAKGRGTRWLAGGSTRGDDAPPGLAQAISGGSGRQRGIVVVVVVIRQRISLQNAEIVIQRH